MAKAQISVTATQLFIFFVALLVCLSPFVRVVGFGLAFVFGLMMMFSLVAGIFLTDMLRADSPTIVTYDGLRKSRSTVESFLETGSDENLPGMSILGYGGIRFLNVNSADPSAMAVPAGAIERLNDTVTLIYSPAVPLARPKALAGILSGEADLLSKMQDSSFDLDKRNSEARIGLLNALVEIPTSEKMRQVQTFIDRSAMSIAEMRDRPRLGQESNIKELRKLAHTIHKESALSVIKRFFTGSDGDRPPSVDPYREDESR